MLENLIAYWKKLPSSLQVNRKRRVIPQHINNVFTSVWHGLSSRTMWCQPSQIARFMGPTWGPPRSCRPQMGPIAMLAPWTLLSGLQHPMGHEHNQNQEFIMLTTLSSLAVSEFVQTHHKKLCTLNPLAPGRSKCDFKNVFFNLDLLIGIIRSSYDNVLRWMPQDLTDD